MSRQNLIQVTCDRCGNGGTSTPEMSEERLAIDEDGRGGWAALGKVDLCPFCKRLADELKLELHADMHNVPLGEMCDILAQTLAKVKKWPGKLPRQEIFLSADKRVRVYVLLNKDKWDDQS